jgi:hypothetical protein
MESTVKRFIGKVLPDGHLSLPDETAKEVGSVFDVVFGLNESLSNRLGNEHKKQFLSDMAKRHEDWQEEDNED